VAECMFLGKPVIATDWSATAEFLNETTGCPVRSSPVTLEKNFGETTIRGAKQMNLPAWHWPAR